MLNLSNEMLSILRNSISSQRPDLLWVIEQEEMIITEEVGDKLRDALNEELLQNGLNSDESPNQLGFKLEYLIDYIGRYYF
ncbi:hypothetical protein CEF21_07655 [Bacillus sp. FJAT-42376]|uniref:hypothetical protein n=1 Tax=Bacillus sp. FJAT-42376 TaxID=2014076 RepID=UPI000F4F9456|nr:hypothetical protein [Bacillus sp. FJAT-42376]AZB42171.1 hypothetical protein CEF21_07655 [Bacillus sp. FJAT-42376]